MNFFKKILKNQNQKEYADFFETEMQQAAQYELIELETNNSGV